VQHISTGPAPIAGAFFDTIKNHRGHLVLPTKTFEGPPSLPVEFFGYQIMTPKRFESEFCHEAFPALAVGAGSGPTLTDGHVAELMDQDFLDLILTFQNIGIEFDKALPRSTYTGS
jgi:hypothetical protein